MAIKVEPSRFALLKVDDDYDSDEKQGGKQGAANKTGKPNNAGSQAAKKKKPNKKKPVELTDEGKQGGKKPTAVPGDKEWEEWSKMDERYVAGAYEKELHEALVTSKLQYEELKRSQAASATQNGTAGASTTATAALSSAARKKEKKKEKAASMSIDAFNAKKQQQLVQQRPRDSDEEEEEHLPKPIVPKTTIPAGEGDTTYFERIESDVRQIIVRDQKQKDFKKQYEVENAQTTKFKSELVSKDKEIALLMDKTKTLEEELQQVKKRNQQLCIILGQGEMKDKEDLLEEVEELRQIRDDLTQEVSRLTSELEKERSKCHGLKGDIDKAKAGKHSGK